MLFILSLLIFFSIFKLYFVSFSLLFESTLYSPNLPNNFNNFITAFIPLSILLYPCPFLLHLANLHVHLSFPCSHSSVHHTQFILSPYPVFILLLVLLHPHPFLFCLTNLHIHSSLGFSHSSIHCTISFILTLFILFSFFKHFFLFQFTITFWLHTIFTHSPVS